ncbi:TetR/AcrR family transcriptional regulator [Salipiger sp. IMCC34102]|uniref:TetR/AcrR family transcriptional regulator n=1 Tax=Salipiger sp. IMCC34102 TaxID=2510647 RepID=UPI00101B6966|nr:TetR/AcrR family transcriptional regulator [Salipiger sp. IMCC34102]RYH02839.1 TetR/AcrR family transcriptional regulator [Salipiger sp. IMCC34102]
MTIRSDTTEKTSGWRGSREGWLAAAREAFVTSGLDAVKIQPLAQQLGLSRTSFYWFFKDRAALLDALLTDWEEANTGSIQAVTQAYSETITEAVLNLIAVFFPGGSFEARLDLAVRGWAHQSDDVAARVNVADRQRLDAIRAMFLRFGYVPDEADVRARTLYLTQIGYISMQVQEPTQERLSRVPNYVTTFTGQIPAQREIDRFMAGFDRPAR